MTVNTGDHQANARLAYVRTAFIEPADHNYVLARIAFERGLVQTGYWEAAQALEKYFKASLLLGGMPAKQGHDFDKMIENHERVWPTLLDTPLPDSSPEPSPVHVDRGGPDSCRSFLQRLGRFGSADNRYTSTGYLFDYLEVNKLDFVALLVRSTCRRPTSIDLFIDWRLDGHLPIESWADNQTNPLAKDFFQGNAVWSAAVAGRPVEVSRQRMSAFQTSALGASLGQLAEPQPSLRTADFLEWLTANVQFGKKGKQALERQIATIRSGSEPDVADGS